MSQKKFWSDVEAAKAEVEEHLKGKKLKDLSLFAVACGIMNFAAWEVYCFEDDRMDLSIEKVAVDFEILQKSITDEMMAQISWSKVEAYGVWLETWILESPKFTAYSTATSKQILSIGKHKNGEVYLTGYAAIQDRVH